MRLLLPLFFFLMASAFPAAAKDADRAALARSVIEGHVIPGYGALAAKTQNLSDKIKTGCGGNISLTARKLQRAFKEAYSAWMRVQHIRFGPAMTDDRFYRFQYWPDKHGQGAKQMRRRLAGSLEEIPNNQQIAGVSVALQGFPAMERILFALAPLKPDQRAKACKLVSSIGFNLSKMAREAKSDWQSYAPKDAQAVLEAVVRNMLEQLQIIASLKLRRPLGKTLETARPRRAESWRSRTSFQNIKANLSGLHNLLGGGGSHRGLASVLPNEGETLGLREAMIAQLSYGIGRIEGHQFSLHDAVSMKEGRAAAAFLISHIEGLRELIIENLAPALGVNIGFNTQDGD